MIYVTGSICGRFDKYKKLLTKIDLRDKDDLYVLGDVIGVEGGSLRVLEDMSMRPNVFPVLGDNEYYAHRIMTEIADETGALRRELPETMREDIKCTVKEFVAMDTDGRAWVMEYISEMPLYEEIMARGREYLLVHSGIGDFSEEKPISDYGISELALSETDYGKCYYKDKTLVTSHCPTNKIDKRYSGQIYRSECHIGLNCTEDGAGYLAAVCLDTGDDYYV